MIEHLPNGDQHGAARMTIYREDRVLHDGLLRSVQPMVLSHQPAASLCAAATGGHRALLRSAHHCRACRRVSTARLRKAAKMVQQPVVEITEAELQALVDELDAERAAGYLAPSVYAEGAGVFVTWSNHGSV